MEILLFVISLALVMGILGQLSHNINTKGKGGKNFICNLNNKNKIYILKTFLYLLLIFCFLMIRRKSAYHDIEYLAFTIFIVLFLVGDMNEYFYKIRIKMNKLFPPLTSKIIFSFVSFLIFIILNEYVSENIAISFSSFSITSSIITFLFSTAYLGTILLLLIAFFIEVIVLIDILKVEKFWVKFSQYLYNTLSDNQKINMRVGLDSSSNNKEKRYSIFLHGLRLILALLIIGNNKIIIEKPDKVIEKIILSTSYTAIPDRCNNLHEYRKQYGRILFIDIDNVSLAIWDENTNKYKFNVTKCEKRK